MIWHRAEPRPAPWFGGINTFAASDRSEGMISHVLGWMIFGLCCPHVTKPPSVSLGKSFLDAIFNADSCRYAATLAYFYRQFGEVLIFGLF